MRALSVIGVGSQSVLGVGVPCILTIFVVVGVLMEV